MLIEKAMMAKHAQVQAGDKGGARSKLGRKQPVMESSVYDEEDTFEVRFGKC